MRIDVVTIFPDYLAPLELSLAGKARDKGLLDLHVHDLRQLDPRPAPHRRRHAVRRRRRHGDEARAVGRGARRPAAGGGPRRRHRGRADARPASRSPRRWPASWPAREQLVFACGRYEGIDQRVLDHAARPRPRCARSRIGDYVLNGGEVAALAITEAVVRLLPGFMGNPESLAEESHEDGLLEYPVYTKPATWRGHDVPPVLLSGDHAAIAAWRHEQAVRRTAERRPDLRPPRDPARRRRGPAGAARRRRRAAHPAAGLLGPGAAGQPRRRDPRAAPSPSTTCGPGPREGTTFVARSAGRLVGAVRGRLHGGAWDIGRLMVAPDLQGRGSGRMLLGPDRGRRPGRGDVVRAVHRGRQPAQPADVQEGRLPARRPSPAPAWCG